MFSLHVCLFATCSLGIVGSHKSLDPGTLLELLVAVSLRVGAGNTTCILGNTTSVLPAEPPLQPLASTLDPPASVFQILGLQVCAHHPWLSFFSIVNTPFSFIPGDGQTVVLNEVDN